MADKENTIKNYSQTWPMPKKLSPIIIIGTGGIVKDCLLYTSPSPRDQA